MRSVISPPDRGAFVVSRYLLGIAAGVVAVAIAGCGGGHHHRDVDVEVEVHDHDHDHDGPTKVYVDRDDRNEVVVEREIVVREAPPPVRVEVVPRAPGPDYVWIGGYWRHDGHRYVWVGGRYDRTTKGRRHVTAHWEQSNRGWVFRPERIEAGDEIRRHDDRGNDDDRRRDARRDDDGRRRDARSDSDNQRRDTRARDDKRRGDDRSSDDDDDRRGGAPGETKRPR